MILISVINDFAEVFLEMNDGFKHFKINLNVVKDLMY